MCHIPHRHDKNRYLNGMIDKVNVFLDNAVKNHKNWRILKHDYVTADHQRDGLHFNELGSATFALEIRHIVRTFANGPRQGYAYLSSRVRRRTVSRSDDDTGCHDADMSQTSDGTDRDVLIDIEPTSVSVVSPPVLTPLNLPEDETTQTKTPTIPESPNRNLNMDGNCKTNVPYGIADIIKSSYMNNTIWSTFSFMRASADGHCILNSIALCLNRLHSIEYRIDLLLDDLTQEGKNFVKYETYFC